VRGVMTSMASRGNKERENVLIITAMRTLGDKGEGAIYNGSGRSMEKLWAEMERGEARRFTKDGDGVHCAR